MIYYVGNKKIKISDDELYDNYIDEGSEVEVFRFDDKVFKLYKPYCNKGRLDENTINKLKNINTKRIIMPDNTIKDSSSKLIGYTMPYIDSYGIDGFKNIKIKNLIDELNIIKNDLLILSKNKIDIEDIHIGNILLGDGLYFVDPGSYRVSGFKEHLLYSLNKYTINIFVLNDILKRFSNISIKNKKVLEELIPVDDEYIGDILDYDNMNNLNIKEYVNTKLKSR